MTNIAQSEHHQEYYDNEIGDEEFCIHINPNIAHAEYAVRGDVVQISDELRERLKRGDKTLPFTKIYSCNIGNPQELGQRPQTYIHQALAIAHYPALLEYPNQFPKDIIERVRLYLSEMHTTGAYTNSRGLQCIRKEIADFIYRRDGYPTHIDNIFLTDGASTGVKQWLQALITSPNDGILCPIPHYPLYSAMLTVLNGHFVGYYMNEEDGWGFDIDNVREVYKDAVENGINIRAISVINPGNPTGQSLRFSDVVNVLKFAKEKRLVVLVDEVYQDNIYIDKPFIPFRKVSQDMKFNLPLVSFHSASKGFYGECGQRAGYFHMSNISKEVNQCIYKFASISQCPNVTGQIVMGLVVHPPEPNSESYELYAKEKEDILSSLRRRAEKVTKYFNQLENVHCQSVNGALYAFPRITLSEKFQQEARKNGKQPDTWYCIKLLYATGICITPGSGFWQEKNTHHFRTTILPQESEMDELLEKFTEFHKNFVKEYG